MATGPSVRWPMDVRPRDADAPHCGSAKRMRMAAKPRFAWAAAAAMERAADAKKPWRYYYVLAFPLSNAPAPEKLAGMLAMTDAIEAREEAYLQRMLDRDPPPPREERASPLARFTTAALRWLSASMALATLVAAAVTYRAQATATGEALDPRVLTAAYVVAASLLAQNAAVIYALRTQSTLLLRGCVLLLCVAVGGAVVLLDELDAISASQEQLLAALAQPRSAFSDAQMELVLNGGEAPSLWHRFFVDGPAWFLLWLERHCVRTNEGDDQDGDDDDDASAVDSTDFFSPLWETRAMQCARDCLATHLHVEAVVRGVALVAVVAMAAQIALCVLLVWIDQFDDVGAASGISSGQRNAMARKRERRRRQQAAKRQARARARGRRGTADSGAFASPVSLLGVVRLACGVLALSGGLLAVVSVTLLTSCSFVGATESWTLTLAAAFGALQVLVALCTVLLWRERLVKAVLVGGLALESYASSALTAFSVAASSSASPQLGGASDSTALLRGAYDFVFQQTCQPFKRWRLHVCVLQDGAARSSPHGAAHVALGDSPACQQQLAELLDATTQHALALVSWMMVTQVVVLAWLLLPSVSALLRRLVALARYQRSPGASSVDAKSVQQQSHDAAGTSRWRAPAGLPLVDARQLYLATVRRQDAATLEAERAAFDAEWAKMTGAGGRSPAASDVVRAPQLEAIVRTLVLRRLSMRCKLDVSLSVSRDGTRLLARVFASDNLLLAALCGERYALQLAEAVDPSARFWQSHPRERKRDALVLDAHTVRQKLKVLELHGIVSRQEADAFAAGPCARVTSARVHALQRLQRARASRHEARVLANAYAAHVAYRPQRALQCLYQRYPHRLDTRATAQQRRAAVLRTVDALRLTKALLDREFDLDAMERRGLLLAAAPLHSASRFDGTSPKAPASREALLACWLAFWRRDDDEDDADDDEEGDKTQQDTAGPKTTTSAVRWLRGLLARASPFRQPLRAVRDYFGESIAFYFAWLAFYCRWLVAPALAATVLLATQTLDVAPLAAFCFGDNDAQATAATAFSLSPRAVAFGLGVVAWAAAFAKAWERRSVWYALEWGVLADEDEEENEDESATADRANFRGEWRRHPVTQQLHVHFPTRRRVPRQLASALVVAAAGLAHVALCAVLLLAQGPAARWLGLRGAVTLSLGAVALLVRANGDAVSALAHALSEWENYASERAFQRAVVLKLCALQLANTFGPLLLVALALFRETASLPLPLPFLRHWHEAFRASVAPRVGALAELQLLLALVFAARIASHALAMANALLRRSLLPAGDACHGASSAAVERELALPAYRGAYEDYAEIAVQLALVASFAGAFPPAPLLALAEAALEMRLDALSLCLFRRRPVPERASGIGPWAACLRALPVAAASVTLALLYLVADNYAAWSAVRRAGTFLASAGAALVANELLWLAVPPRSRAVRVVRARQAFVVDKFFGGGASEDGGGGAGGGSRGGGEGGALREAEKRALKASEAERGDDGDTEDDGEEEAGEATPAHYQERLALLRRLNTALRKRDETLRPEPVEASAPPLEEEDEEVEEEEEEQEEEEEERAVVGYFVRSKASPPPPSPPPPPPLEDVPPRVTEPPPTDATTSTAADAPADTATDTTVEVVVVEETPAPEPYARTALAGLDAIHAAAERERFDFAHDAGWQEPAPDAPQRERRGSFSQSLSRRFSLFRRRRASQDDTPASASAPDAAETATATPPPQQESKKTKKKTKKAKKEDEAKQPAPRVRRESSGTSAPVVQLSGLEAVHEAARRDQFDFSTDPWSAGPSPPS